VSKAVHLVKRFVGSLWPVGPSRAGTEWAEAQLLPAEAELWRRQRKADRRHTIAVGRRVEAALGARAERPVLAAALLHDIGKLDAGFGLYGRTVATLSGMAVRHDPQVIKDWTKTVGMTRRVGLYLQHPRLGGEMLELAGSDPLTVAWAREHHLPAEEWTIPADLAHALHDADDD
jgi:hypothetical protein